MLATKKEPSAEDLRIEQSNRVREAQNHLTYTVVLRSEVYATKEHIVLLKKQLAEAEAGLKSRQARLKTAEAKLAKINPELLKTQVIR
jgi:hypothetical protein